MKTRVYEVRASTLKHPKVRATLTEARKIASAVASTTGHEATVLRLFVEGPDTEVVVDLLRMAFEEGPSEVSEDLFRREVVERHKPTDQIPIATDGPIPWNVEVEKVDPDESEGS